MRPMKRVILSALLVVAVISLIVTALTIRQVAQEEKSLTTDLLYRSTLVAETLKENIEPEVINKSPNLQKLVDRYSDKQRLAGVIIYDNRGSVLAVSQSLPKESTPSAKIAARAMDQDKATGDFTKINSQSAYLFALPLHDKDNVVGALEVVQNANYIDERIFAIWKNNLLGLLVQASLLSVAFILTTRWIIYEPVRTLAQSLKLARLGRLEGNPKTLSEHVLFRPLFNEIKNISKSLFEARRSASEEAKMRLEKIDSPWTTERLKEFVREVLKDRPIYVVSNREPYIHYKDGSSISYLQPAGGVVTAIEPILASCGGTWIAEGSGDADKLVVDENDKIQVPPDDPKYTLKRVWLTKEENDGFYKGFSNEGLWPLCSLVHVRPIFRKDDFEKYTMVNGLFAKTVLSEIKNVENPIILVQDYHFALLPRMIKKSRPDALVGIFWHIPWPNPESFSICPWRAEILDGMLGADLVGFHTQLYCNNFIDTVNRELESLVNLEQFAVTRSGHTSYVKPFPISIPFVNRAQYQAEEGGLEREQALLRERHNLTSQFIILGVDRLDYTKGIIERLKALENLLESDPTYVGRVSLIQISAPTRTSVLEYQQFAKKVADEITRINDKFKTSGWKPIIHLNKHHSHQEIYKYYRLANVCLVTSLHDGMNLVAKEFIAARDDERGVLILSKFAGASQELREALIVNPYDVEQVGRAIREGLEMPLSQQRKTMSKLRERVKNYNIFRWSAELLKSLVSIE